MKGTQSVTEFFVNKTVFITGATGYVGKVLLEKLLRDCKGVKKVYVLLRGCNNSVELSNKLAALKTHPIFDGIRQRDGGKCLEKIHAVSGDLKERDLKINQIDAAVLEKEVNIVFHCAGNVKFDSALRDAIITNTRGTKEILKLARRMENLSVFLYMSTAYSNSNYQYIHEMIYNQPDVTTSSVYDYKTVLSAFERDDGIVINFIERTIIPNVYPNTYVYSKNLAENIVYDASYEIPVCIVRPSIVAPAAREPYAGWADDLNRPIEVFMAGVSGSLRTVYGFKDVIPDLVPVDYAVNSMIVAASHTGQRKQNDKQASNGTCNGTECNSEINRCPIFNCTISTEAGAKWGELIDIAHKVSRENPITTLLWHPTTVMASNYALYIFSFIFFQYIPALFIDGFLVLARRQPFLLGMQKKMFKSVSVLSFYLCKQWRWDNRQLRQLYANLSDNEKYIFNFDANKIDYYILMSNWVASARNALMEIDECEKPPKSRSYFHRVDLILKIVLSAGILFAICYFFMQKYSSPSLSIGRNKFECESCTKFDFFSMTS